MSKKSEAARRETFLDILHRVPHLTLAQLGDLFPVELLSAVRVGDLRPTPLVDQVRLARARGATGADFDALVLEVLREAGIAVQAGHLREHLGGPRWKLQAAIKRLEQARLVAREGTTGTTSYRATPQATPRAHKAKPTRERRPIGERVARPPSDRDDRRADPLSTLPGELR